MSEPVKIVLILNGGQLQQVISCGIPVDYAVIDVTPPEDDCEFTFILRDGESPGGERCNGYRSKAEMFSGAMGLFNAPKEDLR